MTANHDRAPVYFDHNATAPLDPRVADAMAEWLRWGGNASSLHAVGRRAREVVEAARSQVAEFLGAEHPSEIVFGASGTELNNAVLETYSERFFGPEGGVVVRASFEHPSVVAGSDRLARDGAEVRTVAPGRHGVIDAEEFVAACEGARLACLMLANNEIGTIQPVPAIAEGCRRAGVPLLCDAVQAAGKIAVDVAGLGADYLVIAGHKLCGPLGAAALWVRPGAALEPLLMGGSQERRRRASTENVAAVGGLGLACALAGRELDQRQQAMQSLRDEFEDRVRSIEGASIHCAMAPRLPNTSNLRFEGASAADLMIRLDLRGFAVSTGSACASGSVEPSPTLLSIGLDRAAALSALRVSFGASNTAAEVERFVQVLEEEVAVLRTGGRRRFARGGEMGVSEAQVEVASEAVSR